MARYSPNAAPGANHRRRHLRWLVPAVALVLVFEYIVLPQLAGTGNVLRSMARLPLIVLLGALVLQAGSWLSYSALTRVALSEPNGPSYFTLLRIDLCSAAVNRVVPGGSAASAAARYRLLTLAGIPPAEALSAATIQVLSTNLLLGAVFGAGLLTIPGQLGANRYYAVAGAVVLVLFAAAVLLLVVLGRYLDGAVRSARAVARVVPLLKPDAAERFVTTIALEARLLRSRPRRLIAVIVLGSLRWLLDAACLWVLLAGFGSWLAPGELLVGYSLAALVAMLPLTPGGVGLVEGLLVPALAGFGTPSAVAVAGVLAWRILQFWLPIPLGGLAYLSLRIGVLRGRTGRTVPAGGARRQRG